MKKNFIKSRNLSVISIIALGLVVFSKCTKSGTTVAPVNRIVDIASMDSTVFSPFYDSTIVPYANTPAGRNDYAVTNGVMGIIKSKCATAGCHGGAVPPALTNYAAVKNLVVAGSPEASKLWQMLTANLASQAMPPVDAGNDLSVNERNVIYNWITNGAKEQPDISDYRPAAIRSITNGCTSANCHSMPTVVGNWAKSGYIQCSTSDTAGVLISNAAGTNKTWYPQMINKTIMMNAWNAYSDSITAFYADTINGKFPVINSMISHGPFGTYQSILLDIHYPKGNRTSSNTSTRNNYLSASTGVLSRLDSSLQMQNQVTGNWANKDGGMATADGGFGSSDIAIVKAWYFLDPNIPDVWKFGASGNGIFKYVSTQKVIVK
jgi:hypothetical protein